MFALIALLLGPFDVMTLPKAHIGSRIEVVELAPVFHQPFVCGEHPEGSLHYVGDALGRDCVIIGGLDPVTSEGFPKPFRGDGRRNEDWFGFHADVHAPFDGVVEGVNDNPVENTPGHPSKALVGYIAFRRADGLEVTYAHTTRPNVKIGAHVRAGQVVAVVGDNGHARMPHIHIGAWRGTTPFQIRWDLRAEGASHPFSTNDWNPPPTVPPSVRLRAEAARHLVLTRLRVGFESHAGRARRRMSSMTDAA